MESPPISEVNKLENKISPSILPIIVVLAAIFFISGLLHILVRHLLRQQQQQQQQANRDEDEADQSRNVTAFQGRLQQLFHLHDCGVDQSFIDCLPVFLYKAIIGLRVDPFDCAVCLCEFEPDDKLRLIPMCSHAFHVECIDTWLLSHSTCPLCRSSLLSEDFAANSPALAVLESAVESSRYSFSSLSSALDNTIGHDDKVAENEAEDKVVQVKLGKFRNADVGSVIEGGDTGDQKLDQRRCFSLGSYEYVMNETSLLRVAVKPPKKRQVAMSECGAKAFDECSSKSLEPRKKESFSVSKIWLRSGAKEKYGNGESSRRALSFRLPLHYDQSKGKSAEVGGLESEKDVDVEVGSCNNSVVSVESQISQTPSFARRTLMWVVNRQNRVGSYL